MARIAVAGFQHETNTFGVTKAGFADFEMADSWPGMLIGADVIAGTEGINLPIAGFVAAARCDPTIELVPVLWCAAEPSAHVTDDAFERITTMLLDGIRAAAPLDGIYLDLHGAMVTESFDDGEGELLRRLRTVVGPNLPVAVSLDLHANITQAMVEHASTICIFRTYPHLDMAATGARCLPLLMRLIAGALLCKAFRQAPFLIPLHAQDTGAEPCRSLYGLLDQISAAPEVTADIALGFTAADIPDAGPSVIANAPDQVSADNLADRLLAEAVAAEGRFDCAMLTPGEAVRTAMAAAPRPGPVIIADVQDNPGAGATSDTTGLLEALVTEGARGAVIGLMHDPEMAARAHRAGVGMTIEGPLGGRSGLAHQHPFAGRFEVEVLSDGLCPFTGEMYGGATAVLGPCAVLRVVAAGADVRIVVTSRRSQCLDRGLFTHFGIDPGTTRIVCVKSTVHFRADFEPVASKIIVAAAAGAFPCRLTEIPYRRLRHGLRLGPGERPFTGPEGAG